MSDAISDVLTNLARPKTSATLTLRIIKSFEFRTEKSLVLKDINLETTTAGQLKELARQGIDLLYSSTSILTIHTQPGWKPYRTVNLDTLKLYTKAHGAKTSNLIINLDHDDWILKDDSKILADLGFENETEVSFFNGELYEAFKANPQIKWEG
ncbi:hypothetical protein NLI96_g8284 [Meripilus lineatus]|uniref:Uncharacterized protein n=1 Tax=Meripilus lineatus TaxID=2056292 RepID=A0AAD5UZ69_9APHY|nr:hypothetical protein NLI96_g8284 [Physisporinus lineatus]